METHDSTVLVCASPHKSLFDQLYAHRAAIDTAFGAPLSWERLDEKNTCRVAWRLELGGWDSPDTWDQVIPATIDSMERLHAAISPYISGLDAKASS